MGQDQPEALGRVFEVLAGGLGGAAYRRFGGRVQAGTEPEQIHRAPRSDSTHVVSRRAGDAGATEGVASRGRNGLSRTREKALNDAIASTDPGAGFESFAWRSIDSDDGEEGQNLRSRV